MSHGVLAWGRFNAPTEEGHGKLIKAVQDHAAKVGGQHYIFATHTQDNKKNPLSHGEKVGFMRRLFPGANVVANNKVRTIIDAMKHMESMGHTHVHVVAGSDRVAQYEDMLNKYRKKEYPKIKKVTVVSAGNRDPDAEGAEGMSASKLRELVKQGKRKEFIKHYSDPKLGAEIHDRVKAGLQMESTNPIGIFLLGGPGSGKDYVLKNIFSRFDLTEVQADQVLNGTASELIESNVNIVINGITDGLKIEEIQSILEGYTFDFVHVSVTNKVSRLRNEQREQPLSESKRIDKFLKSEKLANSVEAFIFNNSINLNESSEFEKVFFADQIKRLLERVVDLGLELKEESKTKTYMPAKYKTGNPKTDAARAAHWKKMGKYSDRDPRAYKDAPGDKKARAKGLPPSKHTVAVRKIMAKEETVIDEGVADKSLAAKAEKSGVSLRTLKAVYRRGVAAWNSGHRPGTTPSQWGHARVNSYINKGKTYHTADKDLREDTEQLDEKGPGLWANIHAKRERIKRGSGERMRKPGEKGAPTKAQLQSAKEEVELDEMQLIGTDSYRKHAIAMTPGQGEPVDAFPVKSPNKKPSAVVATKGKSIVSQYEEHTECGTPNCCGECATSEENGNEVTSGTNLREAPEKNSSVDTTPTLTSKKKQTGGKPMRAYNARLAGLSVVSNLSLPEETTTGRSILKNVKTIKLQTEDTQLQEAINYHLTEGISFTKNAFRPGSDMFFKMIDEAKRLYTEGKYAPEDEYEQDLLNSDIGEKVMFEGQEVILDYPFEEEPLNEEDKTGGKGIGKPWREGGGGAVYVRTGDGGVKKVRFSQSGMAKKFNDPARVRSFVARHRCLSNKDKTSASYWACRWPRYFSNSGKTWW